MDLPTIAAMRKGPELDRLIHVHVFHLFEIDENIPLYSHDSTDGESVARQMEVRGFVRRTTPYERGNNRRFGFFRPDAATQASEDEPMPREAKRRPLMFCRAALAALFALKEA